MLEWWQCTIAKPFTTTSQILPEETKSYWLNSEVGMHCHKLAAYHNIIDPSTDPLYH